MIPVLTPTSMEKRICPACSGSPRFQSYRYRLREDIDVYQCLECRSIYAIHDIRDYHLFAHKHQEISSYSSHYTQALELKEAMASNSGHESIYSFYEKNKKYREALKLICSRSNRSGLRVLEIGCSSGHFIGALRHLNIEAFGIDISRDAVEFASKTFGDFFFDTNTDSLFSVPGFDVIIMVGTIGCVENPSEFVRNALRLLNPKGILFFNVPTSSFIEASPWKWPDTYPPDLNILFSESFWKEFFDASELGVRFSSNTTYVTRMSLLRSALKSLVHLNLISCFVYLMAFGRHVLCKAIPEPYGTYVFLERVDRQT